MTISIPQGIAQPQLTLGDLALRPDLEVIAEIIPADVSVLDLGCGDGALLDHLVNQKQAKGRGIELSEQDILACVRRGLSVRQGNLQEGLADYPDSSFDYVILAQTLPFLDDPAMILNEMLRVGNQAVVSFSNWGYWRCRLQYLFSGRIPEAADLPQAWHTSPRWQAFTVSDFGDFCKSLEVKTNRQIYLGRSQKLRPTRYKNLLARTAVFVLGREWIT
ncbi:MAG: methionine biosynthesis protein MetW [Chloroflexota bacterium]